MGQKTHPLGFRLGITKNWKSHWLDEKKFAENLSEDIKIKKYIHTRLVNMGIANVGIKRVGVKILVTIATSKPGLVIGQRRAHLEELKAELKKLIGKAVDIYVEVVRIPELESKIVAKTIASQLEGRINHRRAMKRAVSQAMKLGAKGIKVAVSGRLGGAEIARREWYMEGRVPLQTLKADVDYSRDTAYTLYGTVGVKVWIYKGDIDVKKGMK